MKKPLHSLERLGKSDDGNELLAEAADSPEAEEADSKESE